MKIAVTGGSGLVGSHLCTFLTAQGHEVKAFKRDKPTWDPDKGVIDPEAFEGFDAVINLCGENIASGRWTKKKKKRIFESRIKSTRLLADTLAHLKLKPKVFINASAIGFYGDSGDQVVREGSRPGDGFLSHVCQEWEASTAAAKNGGIRTVILRTGVVLTPKGGALSKMLTPFKMGLGGVVGSGGQYFSWIAIDDLVGAILHLINSPSIEGPVNIVSPQPVTNYELTKTLGRVLSRPTVVPMPAFATKMLVGKEPAEEMLLSSTRVDPARLRESGYEFQFPGLESALRHLLGKHA